MSATTTATRTCGRCQGTFPADALVEYLAMFDEWYCVECYARQGIEFIVAYEPQEDAGTVEEAIRDILDWGWAARALSPLAIREERV